MSDKGVHQESESGNWYHDQSININIPSEITGDKLLESLINNREKLERLKYSYWEERKSKDPKENDARVFLREIIRIVNSIEIINLQKI